MSSDSSLSRLPTEPSRGLRYDVRELLVLSAPMIATMISRMAMGFVDFVMVSRLGTEAVAAISPATFGIFTLLCLGMGLAVSIQTYVSQAHGRGDRSASIYACQGFYIAAAFTLLCAPFSAAMPLVWGWTSHEPAVRAMEIEYTQIAIWCMGFAVLCVALDSFFNGVHQPKVTFISVLASLVANVVGNYALIFGHFGFPAMGIRGAAIATVIAWGVRAAMLTAVFLSGRFHREFNTRGGFAFRPRMIRALLVMGAPLSLQYVLDIGAWFVFLAWIMAAYGTEVMAAANITFQFMHIGFMPAVGVAIAVCSQVGFAIGRGRPDLAHHRVRIGLLVAGTYMGLIGLVFLLIPEPLLRLMDADPAVIRFGVQILFWAALFQVLDGIGIVYTHGLRGAGDTLASAAIVISHNWLIFVLGGWLVAYYYPAAGPAGPWMICTLYFIVQACSLRWRFNRGAWRRIELDKQTTVKDSTAVGTPARREELPPAELLVEEALP